MKNKCSNACKRLLNAVFLVLVALSASAQEAKIKGSIVDEKGEPVIGATVRVPGSNSGAVTDLDGNFTVAVASGTKIEVSYVGYGKQTLTAKDGMLVQLVPDNRDLDEVVVVGYGAMKQKNVTGSMTTISAKDLEDLPVATLTEALRGEINGLNVIIGSSRPGANSDDIYIRNARDLNGLGKDSPNNNPLVIVDDVMQLDEQGRPTLAALNTLDPTEVETITVLRDASAAIYGSRAANGAILIKTKRGKAGIPRISYSAKFAYNDAVSHSKVLRGSDFGRFYNSVALNSGKAKETDADAFFSDDEIARMDNIHYDWLDKADWKAAFQTQHTLNVSGGNERATYYAGGSLFDQGANLGRQDYKKYTYRAGVDIRLTSDVKLSASISGNQMKKRTSYTKGARFTMYGGAGSSEKADYNVLHHIPDYIPWSVTLPNEDGEDTEYWMGPYMSPMNTKYRTSKSGSNVYADRSTVSSWNYFALMDNDAYTSSDNNGWNANLSLTYEVPFLKGLSLTLAYSTSHAASYTEQCAFPYDITFISKRPTTGHLLGDDLTPDYYTTGTFMQNTQLIFNGGNTEGNQYNFYVNYANKFGKHDISAMFSIERAQYKSNEWKEAFSNNLPTDFHDIYTGDARNGSLKDYMDTSNTVVTKNRSGSLSYIGRVAYAYDDRYMLQMLFRTDASVKFAPEHWWAFFPSISGGWIVSEEPWFKDNKHLSWIDFLKVRLNWGITGRDNVKGNFQWKQIYDTNNATAMQFGTVNGGYTGGGILPGVASPNRNLRWAKVTKTDLGFDMRLLQGRLGVTWDLFYDINDDIINQYLAEQKGIPVYAGGSFAQQNYGRIDTYGTEITLDWRDKIGEVTYNVGLNWSYNNNKVKKWVPGLNDNKYASDRTNFEEGKSTYLGTYGFKVWKGNAGGDGILRTNEDLQAYWNYLTELATASGTTPKYLGKSNMTDIPLGSLAYQDLGGEMKDGVQQGPNGQVSKSQDYAKLANGNNSWKGGDFRIRLGWKGLTLNTGISFGWGNYRSIEYKKMNINTNGQGFVWAPDVFWADMYDQKYNPNGIYPNYGVEYKLGGTVNAPSDFWQVSSFTCYIRNLTLAYSLPKEWVRPLKITSVRLNLSGQNLWYLYNPYPKHYRNMYDKSDIDYPTLRTWSLGLNITF